MPKESRRERPAVILGRPRFKPLAIVWVSNARPWPSPVPSPCRSSAVLATHATRRVFPFSNAKCKFYLWIWFLATNNSAQHTRSPYNKNPEILVWQTHTNSRRWKHKPELLLLAPGGGGCSCVNPCTVPVRDPAAVGRSSACQKFTIYHLWLTCARVKIIKYAAGSGAHHTHTHTHAHPYTPMHCAGMFCHGPEALLTA